MSDEEHPELPPSVEHWRGEFMQAAAKHASQRSSWRRRLLAPLVAIVVIGSASVAVAEIAGRIGSPELPPYEGETHAYLNLATGDPIRCPDGELLTYTPPPGTTEYADAKCADGSVPSVYQRQLDALNQYAQNAEFGSPASEGPRFAYEIQAGD